MSATNLAPGATSPTASRTSPYRLTFGHVLRSEWIKFRSLRSTWWTIGTTIVVMVLFSMSMAASLNFAAETPEMAAEMGNISTVQAIVLGYIFAQLSVAVLGALVITGEYSTGMIRSTLSAVPTRLPALWAKAGIIGVVTFVVGIVGIALSYLVTTPMLSGNDLVPDLGDSVVQRVVLACAGYLALVALVAVGIGTIMRHSAGSIFTLVAFLFVLPLVASFLSQDWVQDIAKFLPMNLATAMMAVTEADAGGVEVLSPGNATVAMVAWAVVSLGAAAVVLKRRDA
ncbi:ABC transporter permease subunit [Cellulosimicrobium cellulans]|uniref:ABC transporter permease subunit n=1 Tax=Cellulosimicrobium cellulans TaxID=1710 RepID=UPI002405DD0D|nr:ABC transporter permease subunit [Cellulosimicrobium cellulans]MDF9878028.1 ABC-2 type transport system permease protein [Cellulosimicrobium cellulans]